ncbi:MAG: DUF3782 domain-containing protein [Candidatus Lokiarchaeota archaeon]|nr:DUF3782 domain-containing protein [Candidatus Lokiarchaeota archaeon]
MTTKAAKNANEIDVQKLIEMLPKLIRENDTVKGAIITALSGVVATKDDIKALIAEMDKRFEAMDKRFEALHADVKRTALDVATLSRRSGDDLEEMVRSLMHDILVRHRVDLTDVKKVELADEKGAIFAPGYTTHVDVVARDGEVHLYEIKYRADQRDAYHFMQVARLHELVTGKRASRMVMLVLEISSATLRAISKFPVPIDIIAGSVVP